jgi:hypothetical protein
LSSGNNSLADILDGDDDENEKLEDISSEELKLNVAPIDESSGKVVGADAAAVLPSHSIDNSTSSEIETMSAASLEVVVEGKGTDDDWTGSVQLEVASTSSSLGSSRGVGESDDEIVNEVELQGSEEESHEATRSIEESSSEMINVVASSEGDNE